MGAVRRRRGTVASGSVCLLWLEVPALGTAPGFHLEGTLERLRLVQPDAQVTVVARSGGPLLVDHLRTFVRFTAAVAGCDVVICRWHAATLPSLLLARAHRRPVVLLVQGTVASKFRSWSVPCSNPAGPPLSLSVSRIGRRSRSWPV